jgi:hypothetical protein
MDSIIFAPCVVLTPLTYWNYNFVFPIFSPLFSPLFSFEFTSWNPLGLQLLSWVYFWLRAFLRQVTMSIARFSLRQDLSLVYNVYPSIITVVKHYGFKTGIALIHINKNTSVEPIPHGIGYEDA